MPTAKQLIVSGQDTAWSSSKADGLGVPAMTDQRLPFQRSTTVRRTNRSGEKELPTAKQLVVLGHDTPASSSKPPCLGRPVVVDQRFPFQCTIRLPSPRKPTAKQLVVLGQDTPSSQEPSSVPTFGLGMIDQLFPSQCSTKAWELGPSDAPTAKQFVVLGHATPSKLA